MKWTEVYGPMSSILHLLTSKHEPLSSHFGPYGDDFACGVREILLQIFLVYNLPYYLFLGFQGFYLIYKLMVHLLYTELCLITKYRC